MATGLARWPACASTAGPRRPGLERLFGLPLRHHEVAVLALDRAQQLEAEETGLVVDGVRTVGEPLLQFRAGVGRNFDCVDLHHGHGGQVTVRVAVDRQDDGMRTDLLTRRGGAASRSSWCTG